MEIANMTDEVFYSEIKKLQTQVETLSYDCKNLSWDEGVARLQKLRSLKKEVNDTINELEVEDFLLNGPGNSVDVEYNNN